MEYYSFNKYMRDRFGTKVYKIALDAGLTCPNRDGTIDTRGCIFCSEGGSGEFAQKITLENVKEQLENAKKRIEKKNNGGKYMAYFQAFSNTYGPIKYLESIFMECIMQEDIVALSIATRPDCIGDEVLELLQKLNKIKPIFVELGLQTIHENSAQYIRRGYALSVFDDAVKRLKCADIEVIVHVILGLPYETEEDILKTVDYVGKSGAGGIKLQLLHVLKGTDLAKDYEAGKFETLTMEQYINLVVKCLKILPDDMVIHRLTGDGDKKLLIAPLWSMDKKKVLNALNKAIASAYTIHKI